MMRCCWRSAQAPAPEFASTLVVTQEGRVEIDPDHPRRQPSESVRRRPAWDAGRGLFADRLGRRRPARRGLDRSLPAGRVADGDTAPTKATRLLPLRQRRRACARPARRARRADAGYSRAEAMRRSRALLPLPLHGMRQGVRIPQALRLLSQALRPRHLQQRQHRHGDSQGQSHDRQLHAVRPVRHDCARTTSAWARCASKRAGTWSTPAICPPRTTISRCATWRTAARRRRPSRAASPAAPTSADARSSPAASYRPRRPGTSSASMRILAGQDPWRRRPDGRLLRRARAWSGRRALHDEVKAGLRETWRSLGEPQIVTACSTCLKMLGDFHPGDEGALAVDRDRRDRLAGRPAAAFAGPLAIHDPCTGRRAIDAQRAVRRLAGRPRRRPCASSAARS